MRTLVLTALAWCFLTGCATRVYNSSRPAFAVAECIAEGWRTSPHSGMPAPVSVTKKDEYWFVGVEVGAPGFGEHPLHAVWAEVREVPEGSTTRYHRSMQIAHKRIDGAVVECQK